MAAAIPMVILVDLVRFMVPQRKTPQPGGKIHPRPGPIGMIKYNATGRDKCSPFYKLRKNPVFGWLSYLLIFPVPFWLNSDFPAPALAGTWSCGLSGDDLPPFQGASAIQ